MTRKRWTKLWPGHMRSSPSWRLWWARLNERHPSGGAVLPPIVEVRQRTKCDVASANTSSCTRAVKSATPRPPGSPQRSSQHLSPISRAMAAPARSAAKLGLLTNCCYGAICTEKLAVVPLTYGPLEGGSCVALLLHFIVKVTFSVAGRVCDIETLP